MPEDIEPALLQQLSDEFDRSCQDRHNMGEKKYGPVKFFTVNAFEEAMAELVDLANYARYSWIKMALMAHLDSSGPVEPEDVEDTDLNIRSSGHNAPQGREQLGQLSSGFFNPYRKDA